MHRALVLLALAQLGCFNPKVQNGGFACDPGDQPPCPAGFSCVNHRCVNGAAPIVIDKTGPSFMGQHSDPGLDTAAECPDESLEPNDGTAPPAGRPIDVAVTPDAMTAKLTKLAICPKGLSPATHLHDVDYFRVDATSGAAVTLMAELFYEITYGDLDVGIFDANGTLLAADGTAMSNGCVTAPIGSGVYYVVVTGAGNVDVNNYELRVRSFTKPTSCPAAAAADMAVAPHD